MPTRRGFLKFLGKGGLAGVAGAGYVVSADPAVGESHTAFNFTCTCGEGFICKTPKVEGGQQILSCQCGNIWSLTWAGDHFKTKLDHHGPNQGLLASEEAEEPMPADPNLFAGPMERGKMIRIGHDWIATREFDWAEKLSDGTVYQHRMELRQRSDGRVFFQGHNLRNGMKTANCSPLWQERLNKNYTLHPPLTPQQFNEEFAKMMKQHSGTEVFV